MQQNKENHIFLIHNKPSFPKLTLEIKRIFDYELSLANLHQGQSQVQNNILDLKSNIEKGISVLFFFSKNESEYLLLNKSFKFNNGKFKMND